MASIEETTGAKRAGGRASLQVRRIAREALGYASLRPGQEEAMQSVLQGRDTVAVMPTGSGKSAIYQIGGLRLPGPTVVVSPLIALQRDQLESLAEIALQRDQLESLAEGEVAAGAIVNSTVGATERHEAFEDLQGGEVEFLFLAPEQFGREEVLEEVRQAGPSLFVVDEAHCISEWGHDFRPDYLKLGAVIEALGHPTVLALTATASERVREEIVRRLGLRDPRVIVTGFDRPNIWLGVEAFEKETAKRVALVARVGAAEKPGIVYVATRRQAEELADALRQQGVGVEFYHAGMATAERKRVQADFMEDRLPVIVATSAFGMGIDKPDVRFVFHHHVSESLDAYYQGIGRAGRDGEPARAVLFYRPEDLALRRFFASGGQVDAEQLELVAETVHDSAEPLSMDELREQTDLSRAKLATALARLEEVGAVEALPAGRVARVDAAADLPDAAEEAARGQERQRNLELARIEMMRGYAEAPGCRRRYLLRYFGEELAEPCGRCDNCESGLAAQAEAADAADGRPFPVRSRVRHSEWGEGIVLGYEEDRVTVLFEEVGQKTLAVGLVLERGLLAAG